MTITIEVTGTALDRLQEVIGRLEDQQPAMREIAEALRDRAEEAFQLEGPGWYPLAESTVRKRGSAHPILQDSGQLAASLAVAFGKDFASVGSNKDYAAIQHLGGTTGRGMLARIPARPYLPVQVSGELTAPAERDVLEILERYFLRATG